MTGTNVRAGVLAARTCGGREVEPAERRRTGRAVPAARRSPPSARLDPGERQALGVDQLDDAGSAPRSSGQGQRDRAARLVEAGERREGAATTSSSRSSSSRGVGQCWGTAGESGTGRHPATRRSIACAQSAVACIPSSSPRSSARGSSRATTTARVVALDRDGEVDWSVGDGATPRCCRARATSRSRRWRWCGSGSTCRPTCSRWRARRTRARPSTSTGVRRILAAAGLDESALQTPPDYPLDDDAREAVDPRRRRANADR